MNPEIKAMWVAALRSGAYEQGFWRLKSDDNKFCCLGVLCDLHRKNWSGTPWKENSLYLGRAFDLPQSVCNWASLGYNHQTVGILMAMNDKSKRSFSEIADYIEANL